MHVTPDGRVVDPTPSGKRVRSELLPTAADDAFVAVAHVAVHEPGQMAGWLAPPATGIHAKPVDFEYVRS